MSVIQKSAFDSSKFKHKIKSAPSISTGAKKGPIKASYELPNQQWQMKYQFNSPSKTLQNGTKSKKAASAKVVEESSEYGTMENPEPGVPHLNMVEDNSFFNEVTIAERRKRIESILDEILSIPRLAEANITQRSLSRSSMARFTGGGSVRGSSQMSRVSRGKEAVPGAGAGSRQSGYSRHSVTSQDRRPALVRSVSSPKLSSVNMNTMSSFSRPDTKRAAGVRAAGHGSLGRAASTASVAGGGTKPGRASSQGRKNKSVVPQLSLGLDVTTRSDLPIRARVEDELSAEFLPAHDTAALRPALGEDTQAELVLAMATLGDDTIAPGEEGDTFDTEQSTDFVKANMRVVPKKILSSGRNSAASTIVSAKHKAGSVPK